MSTQTSGDEKKCFDFAKRHGPKNCLNRVESRYGGKTRATYTIEWFPGQRLVDVLSSAIQTRRRQRRHRPAVIVYRAYALRNDDDRSITDVSKNVRPADSRPSVIDRLDHTRILPYEFLFPLTPPPRFRSVWKKKKSYANRRAGCYGSCT